MLEGVRISRTVFQLMLAESRRNQTEECCGLLAGRDGVISTIFPATNSLHSATAFEIAPTDLFFLLKKMRAEGLDFLGIYHSHPSTENAPSPTDIEQAYYPGAVYFIVSPQRNAEKPVRAFSIRDGKVTELEIEVVT